MRNEDGISRVGLFHQRPGITRETHLFNSLNQYEKNGAGSSRYNGGAGGHGHSMMGFRNSMDSRPRVHSLLQEEDR